MKPRALLLLLAGALVAPLGSPAAAQVGRELVITVSVADRLRPTGGSYYVGFTMDETILSGPQGDSSYWTHYVVLRGGRFFFGRVPAAPFRPFGFETIRPPDPLTTGQLLPDGRAFRVTLPLVNLQTGTTPPRQVKLNVVTVDETFRPLDALGRGADDRFGFLTLNLLRDTYLAFTDPPRDAREPAFDIVGGDIAIVIP